jgi:hypothetical protein
MGYAIRNRGRCAHDCERGVPQATSCGAVTHVRFSSTRVSRIQSPQLQSPIIFGYIFQDHVTNLSCRFSRRSILDFIHIIYRHIDTLSIRMQECESRKEPLNLTNAFPALTGDIIMDYFFGFNYAQLKSPDFASFHEAFIKIGGTGHIATQFPWFLPVMNSIPDSITEWLQPAAAPLLKFKRVSKTSHLYPSPSGCSCTIGPSRQHCPHARRRHRQDKRRKNNHLPRNPCLQAPGRRQDTQTPCRRSPNCCRWRRRNNRLRPLHRSLPHHQHAPHLRAPARRPRRHLPEPRHSGIVSSRKHAVSKGLHHGSRAFELWSLCT